MARSIPSSQRRVASAVHDSCDPEINRRSLAVWAWEFLRRNSEYQKDYQQGVSAKGTEKNVHERWGLLTLADPALSASDADVFWSPSLLRGALRVGFEPLKPPRFSKHGAQSRIVLSQLNCDLSTFEADDGSQHIRLGGTDFWIQLYCPKTTDALDQSQLVVSLADFTDGHRALDTASYVFALHRAKGKQAPVSGPTRQSGKLSNMIRAYDIRQAGGTYRDMAIAIHGPKRVVAEWGSSGRCSRDQMRRLYKRGLYFVDRGYRDLLSKKD